MHRQILRIALPAIATNITVPLLGLVDVAIVGHLGSASYIGAIAVGSMIFNLVYWAFGFLRMGTSGLTSQALGSRRLADAAGLLRHSVLLALGVSGGILLFQYPLFCFMLWLIAPTPDVLPHVTTYYYICVWGAPATLVTYSLTGWYIGMQNTRSPMVVSMAQNVANMVASLVFVLGLGMKITGVALGTVLAQYVGIAVSFFLLRKYYGKHLLRALPKMWSMRGLSVGFFARDKGRGFLRVNRDIFLRTLFLVVVNLMFTSVGARQGAVMLSVNTLLMQLYLLFSYVMDGFAYAAEALGGRYYGAANMKAMRRAVRGVFLWGAMLTLLFTVIYALGGQPILALLTNDVNVLDAARPFYPWALLIPALGVAAFLWDGLFIGITQTSAMLASAAVSAVVFVAVFSLLQPYMGNHALWAAFILYLASRSAMQTIQYVRWCSRCSS